MTFDPFFDFETRGYLRNRFGEKDITIVRRLEHSAFVQGVEQAFAMLSRIERLTYHDVLATHERLFGDLYPWAGQDREETAPDLAVSRGEVLFAHPKDARLAVEHALRIGRDRIAMRERPGEVMGFLAYGHPFLDGNGRTIMVIHTELAQRAGVAVDWSATDKDPYLAALTRELQKPGHGHLDAYLKPFLGRAIGREGLPDHVARTRGIDGMRSNAVANEVSGSFTDAALQARYRQQTQEREVRYNGGDAGEPGEPATGRNPELGRQASGRKE